MKIFFPSGSFIYCHACQKHRSPTDKVTCKLYYLFREKRGIGWRGEESNRERLAEINFIKLIVSLETQQIRTPHLLPYILCQKRAYEEGSKSGPPLFLKSGMVQSSSEQAKAPSLRGLSLNGKDSPGGREGGTNGRSFKQAGSEVKRHGYYLSNGTIFQKPPPPHTLGDCAVSEGRDKSEEASRGGLCRERLVGLGV